MLSERAAEKGAVIAQTYAFDPVRRRRKMT